MPRRPSGPPNNQEPRRKWRRMIVYSDSEDSDNSDSDRQQIEENVHVNMPPPPSPERNVEILEDPSPSEPAPQQSNLPPETSSLNQTQTDPAAEVQEPDIDAELLAALGEPADDIPVYGEKIQQDLANRWLSLLNKGMPKEKKDTLLKEYAVPENCKLLRAPTLNDEVASAISDSVRNRDKQLETKQNQLGLGVTAVGKGLSLLLTSDDKQKKIQAIKSVSDGCKILADLHFLDTQSRRKLLSPNLDKGFLQVVKDVERDETLFSSKLSEKIKVSKTIEKQGLLIKKPVPTQKNPSTSAASYNRSSSTSSRPPRGQGNWVSSSRYQPPNRGGRGGSSYRHTAPTRRAPPPAQPTTSHKYHSSTNNQRAQTRH